MDKIVAAVDLGTSNSMCGYVLSNFPLPYEPKYCFPDCGHLNEVREKTPTALLVKRGTLEGVSFGERALRRWQDDNNSGEAPEFHLFRAFKMRLYEIDSDADAVVLSEDGFIMEVGSVIRKSLQLIKKALIERINREYPAFIQNADEQITWFVTVPAVWSQMARTRMQTWAHAAGLRNAQLTLEPEAAAISNMTRDHVQVEVQQRNLTEFLLVDVGGGTVDISGIRVESTNPLQVRNLYAQRGAAIGGEQVDDKFAEMLKSVILHAGFERISQEAMFQLKVLVNHFSLLKKERSRHGIDLARLISTLYEGRARTTPFSMHADISAGVAAYNRIHSTNLEYRNNSFLITTISDMEHFYQETTTGICAAIRAALTEKDLKTIVMTGGLSGSTILADAVTEQFASVNGENSGARRIFFAGSPSLDIARGSVLSGIATMNGMEIITSRILHRGYGVHYVGRYHILVNAGDNVPVGSEVTGRGQPETPEQPRCIIPIYTHGVNPNDVTQQRQIGQLDVPITPGVDTSVTYRIKFGTTTISAAAWANVSQTVISGVFQLTNA